MAIDNREIDEELTEIAREALTATQVKFDRRELRRRIRSMQNQILHLASKLADEVDKAGG